ncbi:ASCH domain-containing protein [Pseudomonas lactis]|uniref:ASCH domain-containing protein n=1 Tax=Pseudomonas lactis TaxID=1615674 RepID=UPI0005C83EF7|nr:ASCH domain-containing protein [Pseudomonas lactis]
MKILLSIKPEFAEKIFQGEKLFEFRKSIFKRADISKVVVYATMPVGKVIGEFDIDGVIEGSPKKVWAQTKKHAGITSNFFSEYFTGRERAFAIKVGGTLRYEQPLNLSDLADGMVAPQSYRYL